MTLDSSLCQRNEETTVGKLKMQMKNKSVLRDHLNLIYFQLITTLAADNCWQLLSERRYDILNIGHRPNFATENYHEKLKGNIECDYKPRNSENRIN